MKPKFKVGMRVKVTVFGSGCGPDDVGQIVEIVEVGRYREEIGYKVFPKIGNTKTGSFCGFIGEGSFELSGKYFQKKLE